MNQLQKTQEIIKEAKSLQDVMIHLCELQATLIDIFQEDDFQLEPTKPKKRAVSKKADRVPVKAIVDLYNETVVHLPKVRILPPAAKGHIQRDWKEHKQLQSLEKWKQLFILCDNNLFLTDRLDTGRPWKANLAWIVNPNNLAKIVNGNYKEHDTKPGSK